MCDELKKMFFDNIADWGKPRPPRVLFTRFATYGTVGSVFKKLIDNGCIDVEKATLDATLSKKSRGIPYLVKKYDTVSITQTDNPQETSNFLRALTHVFCNVEKINRTGDRVHGRCSRYSNGVTFSLNNDDDRIYLKMQNNGQSVYDSYCHEEVFSATIRILSDSEKNKNQ